MALLFTVAIAMGRAGGGESADSAQPPPAGNPEPPSEEEEPAPLPKGLVSTHDLVERHEALPCTGPKDPINFEIFSAGPEVAGLPLNATVRRCDTAAPAYEAPTNRITYIYGSCEPPEGEGGCAPPLEIQTWPACQRSKAGYTFEGEPLPYRELSKRGGAEVVEFNFELENRIEVYTKSSTVVIFADNRELALQAVALLMPQKKGAPPAMNQAELQGSPPETLGSPREGATQGKLKCQV